MSSASALLQISPFLGTLIRTSLIDFGHFDLFDQIEIPDVIFLENFIMFENEKVKNH